MLCRALPAAHPAPGSHPPVAYGLAYRRLLARLLGLLLRRAKLRALRFQLLAELRQTLIGFQEAFFQKPDLTGAITASAATKHPAENEASNQPGEYAGDEQKDGSQS